MASSAAAALKVTWGDIIETEVARAAADDDLYASLVRQRTKWANWAHELNISVGFFLLKSMDKRESQN